MVGLVCWDWQVLASRCCPTLLPPPTHPPTHPPPTPCLCTFACTLLLRRHAPSQPSPILAPLPPPHLQTLYIWCTELRLRREFLQQCAQDGTNGQVGASPALLTCRLLACSSTSVCCADSGTAHGRAACCREASHVAHVFSVWRCKLSLDHPLPSPVHFDTHAGAGAACSKRAGAGHD